MNPPFKPSTVELDQRLMFPTNVFDLLSEDHECYLYEDIFKQLDTSELVRCQRRKFRVLRRTSWGGIMPTTGCAAMKRVSAAMRMKCASCSLNRWDGGESGQYELYEKFNLLLKPFPLPNPRIMVTLW